MMNSEILWLPGWYPNELAPFDGDFIQRHAKAVALYKKVTVTFVKKDEDGSVTKNIKEVFSAKNGFKEVIIYYHSFKTGLKLLDKIISSFRYKKIYYSAIKKYIAQNGQPLLAHVHVALKAGIIALWLKRKFKIPYILSEHWSGYFKENKSGINTLSFYQLNLLKKIFKEAEKLTFVSNVLGEAIKQNVTYVEYEVIPNTVDDTIFFPVSNLNTVPHFIHISSLNNEKNPFQIIEAFHLVKQNGYEFRLLIYGPKRENLISLIQEKNLSEYIEFKKEVPQAILAEGVRKADALVLFSNYETFGCVVIEANASGVPAILSDLNVFKEYIDDNINGIFARKGDAVDLSKIIIDFINNKFHFDKTLISKNTIEKFGYKAIGKKFCELYNQILKR